MKLPDSEHTSRPWRIHEIAPDFRLEDVWGIPWHRSQDDFREAIRVLSRFDPAKSGSPVVRSLFAIRWKLGELLHWDAPGGGIGSRVSSLRDRLPDDLRQAPGPEFDAVPFTSLYLLDDEFAAEIANETMHGVMHIGLVEDGGGAHRAQMAVLVKPNGLLGAAYMAAIRPFRHLLVYPPLLKEMERGLQTRSDRATPGPERTLPERRRCHSSSPRPAATARAARCSSRSTP